jgi:hypothetical protein
MAVQLATKTTMAVSIYPKEANPLWGETSTITAHTLKVILHILSLSESSFGFCRRSGMEYPMICWNFGRPDENG